MRVRNQRHLRRAVTPRTTDVVQPLLRRKPSIILTLRSGTSRTADKVAVLASGIFATILSRRLCSRFSDSTAGRHTPFEE